MEGDDAARQRRHNIRCKLCNQNSGRLYCAACARAKMYRPRLSHAQILVSRNFSHQQAIAILDAQDDEQTSSYLTSDTRIVIHECQNTTARMALRDHANTIRERVAAAISNANDLQRRMTELKSLLEQKHAHLSLRRSQFRSSRDNLDQNRNRTLDTIKKQRKNTLSKHQSLQSQIISARAYLCKEAASLSGLQQRQQKTADPTLTYVYMLGENRLFDLRELHSVPPQHFTAVMANISRLLVLSCHYLHIRLPAQITLPFRDHPQPTICPPTTSYEERTVLHNNSVSTSKVSPYHVTVSRPRVLWLDRKVSALAREDSNAYSRIVEAASLLAWDVAWLCRVQGIAIASDDWTETMAIGRNLWLLLVSEPNELLKQSGRKFSNRINSTIERRSHLASGSTSFGFLSHGTAFNFLESAVSNRAANMHVTGPEWSFSHPSKLSDKLKGFLHAEMSGLEWEMLEDHELDGHERPIAIDAGYKLVNDLGHTKPTRPLVPDTDTDTRADPSLGSTSVVVRDPISNCIDTALPSDSERRQQNSSGWTKLKSRLID
ncbi:hypothetical protein FH972_026021 [Carpinus fangiana]|uniref:UV radiation resistance protein and autophagy-related subunit 14-domain-containing protein n=1 Tax=Carpinus fangiana TaxID=176857 RepID=A0A5N6L2Q7_9ROSI|nr:hypothetical protein FH972_026021 [Carpinus fangiana]